MLEAWSRERRHPNWTIVVAGVLVVAGFGLTNLSWWFLLLAAAGTFAPGILRELGWLHDKDEFQRQAAHRAGYHAYLAAGVAAVVLVAFFRSGERFVRDVDELATLFLSLLWFTWFLSSLTAYWGPRKAATRILVVFGSVWLAFTVASNVGPEWSGWAPLLLHPLLAMPFFFLAWLSRRRPRLTSALLVAVSTFFIWFFGWFRPGNFGLITQGVTMIFFLGPLLASSVALLSAGAAKDDVV